MCLGAVAVLAGGGRIGPEAPGVYVAIAVFVGWFGFVGWRCIRMMRAMTLRKDRHFDRQGRFDLPPEYRDTQSATKARALCRQSRQHPNGQ